MDQSNECEYAYDDAAAHSNEGNSYLKFPKSIPTTDILIGKNELS